MSVGPETYFLFSMRARAASKLSKKIWGWKGREFSFEYSYLTLKETIWSLLRLYFAPKEDFFLVGYVILKDFSYLFGAKFTCRKFCRWRHDNWPIGQWEIFHAAPDSLYVNHFFFPREFLIWFTSIQAKQVDHETSSLARSLRDLMHRSSFSSHLRTYDKSTCSKSILGTIK